MNRVYSIVWSRSRGAWTVAGENARRHGRAGSAKVAGSAGNAGNPQFCFGWQRTAQAVAIGLALLAPGFVLAQGLPTGGQVVAGAGAIGTPQDGNLAIDQASQRMAIDWQQFNIGAGNVVRFNQPGADAVALNRVLGPDGSQIMGQLQANGRVFLVNPNGVLFGHNAQVDVGGLVASTLNISNADFMAGNYRFTGEGAGQDAPASSTAQPAAVVNQGRITAADGGAVALLGGQVHNQGVIQARMGTVAMAAGNAVTLDFAGDGLLNVQIDQSAKNALVDNGHLIQADGGQVLMTAHASDALLQTVVNNTGVVEARTLENRQGKIVLLGDFAGGTVKVDGKLDAGAPGGGDGGFIDTSGAYVQVADSVKVTTYAPYGKTGTWLIDPTDFTIRAGEGGSPAPGSSEIGADTLSDLLNINNVNIATADAGDQAGDIHVNAPVTWTSEHYLELNAHNDININSAITAEGNGAGLLLNAERDINVEAVIIFSADSAQMEFVAGRNINVNGSLSTTGNTWIELNAGRGPQGGDIIIDAPISMTGGNGNIVLDTDGEIFVRDTVVLNGNENYILVSGSHISVSNDAGDAQITINGADGAISLAACATSGCGSVIVNDTVSITGDRGVISIVADGGIYSAGDISIIGDDGVISLAGSSIEVSEDATIRIEDEGAGTGTGAIGLVACGVTDCDFLLAGSDLIDVSSKPLLGQGQLAVAGQILIDVEGNGSIMLLGADVDIQETARIDMLADQAGLLVMACGDSACLDADTGLEEDLRDAPAPSGGLLSINRSDIHRRLRRERHDDWWRLVVRFFASLEHRPKWSNFTCRRESLA